MNIVTKDRYSELAGVAQELMQEVGKLRTTCKAAPCPTQITLTPFIAVRHLLTILYTYVMRLDSDFEPYLERIDEISQQAEVISNIAAELDEYTKSLGMQSGREVLCRSM